MSVIRHDIHKHFFLCQDVTIFAVALEPESRSLMVKVVCYAEIILSHFLNIFVDCNLHVVAQVILCNVMALRKYVVLCWCRIIFLFFLHLRHHLIHVSYFLFIIVWFRVSNLWHQLCIHIHNVFLFSSFVIHCFGPSIAKINLFYALSSIFDILDSSGAWNFFGDEELLLVWESLVELLLVTTRPSKRINIPLEPTHNFTYFQVEHL